ncbi:hypothetical protein IFM89_039967 [Coptis chinensis]|uniref:6-phosphogluconate dehydrogenase NADP-binding domain-containing protein n=1 Tax=Coptis chinensis TaxID=261450 RepID=A0A835GUS9_9MAGN|nr:hypothetical protein IFM89_039967 [Coptis chinensis]
MKASKVTSQSPRMCDEPLEHGASVGTTPAEVVKKCKYTIGMLSDPSVSISVVFDKDGVLEQIGEGKCYIDISNELMPILHQRSVREHQNVECPVLVDFQVTKLKEDMDTGINQAEELESITTTVEPLTSSAEGLVRRACEKDVSLISAFEASLFPIIQDILAKEVITGSSELKLTSVASTKLICMGIGATPKITIVKDTRRGTNTTTILFTVFCVASDALIKKGHQPITFVRTIMQPRSFSSFNRAGFSPQSMQESQIQLVHLLQYG